MLRRLAILCMCGGVAAAAPADDVFRLPEAFRVNKDTVPPCTLLQVVPGSKAGKKTTLQDAGGRWGRFKVSTELVETRRVDDFAECVAASEKLTRHYPPEVLSAFNGDRIAIGMPIEFARITLGPSVKDDYEVHTTPDMYKWEPNTATLGRIDLVGLRSVPTARLEAARWVRMKTGKHGEILSILIGESLSTGPGFSLPSDAASDRDSRYAIGMSAYERGEHSAAFETWVPLAEEGHPPAQYSIADLHYRGEGTEQSSEQAVRWFTQAAENLYPPAQYHLGYLYAAGEVVPRNLIEAHRWMRAAASLGHPDAGAARDRVAQMMTPEELESAQALYEKTVFTNPVLLEHVDPEYPELARVARVHGQVILQALVDVNGRVNDVEVIRTNRPNLGFEESAIEAVLQWRHTPAMQDGVPIQVYFTVVVDFSLR